MTNVQVCECEMQASPSTRTVGTMVRFTNPRQCKTTQTLHSGESATYVEYTEDTSRNLQGARLYALERYLQGHCGTVMGIVEQLKWIDEGPCGDGWSSAWAERWKDASVS